eukprot:134174-Amphidinium_carterae.1
MALRRNKVVLGVAPLADDGGADRDIAMTPTALPPTVTPGASASSSGPLPSARTTAPKAGG